MSLGFPLFILWLRQGVGIYPDSAEGSITLSIPRNQVSASQKLLHPPADKQECGLENNNKKLVDKIKMVTAEVRGFEFYYHSRINHRFSACITFHMKGNHLEAASHGSEGLFYLSQTYLLLPSPQKWKNFPQKIWKS